MASGDGRPTDGSGESDGSGEEGPTRRGSLVGQAAACAARAVGLLVRRRLHLRRSLVGTPAMLPDGRAFRVFRETTCDGGPGAGGTTLAVWFHLRGVPPGSRVRPFLFERLCIVNTLLFAGFPGFRTKLWMVDPPTADYAGLYAWRSAGEAEVYARYIVAVLSPFSTRDSVGYQVIPEVRLEEWLAA